MAWFLSMVEVTYIPQTDASLRYKTRTANIFQLFFHSPCGCYILLTDDDSYMHEQDAYSLTSAISWF